MYFEYGNEAYGVIAVFDNIYRLFVKTGGRYCGTESQRIILDISLKSREELLDAVNAGLWSVVMQADD